MTSAPVSGSRPSKARNRPARASWRQRHRDRALPEIGADHGLDRRWQIVPKLFMNQASARLRAPVSALRAARPPRRRRRPRRAPGPAAARAGRRSRRRAERSPISWSVTTIAPGLIKGLRGLPRSLSSWTIELNALPEGSRPTLSHKLRADPVERQRKHEHLGDRLDREGLVAIAGAPAAPVLVGEGDAELGRGRPGQAGSVGRRGRPPER